MGRPHPRPPHDATFYDLTKLFSTNFDLGFLYTHTHTYRIVTSLISGH